MTFTAHSSWITHIRFGLMCFIGLCASLRGVAAPIPLALYHAGDNPVAWSPSMWAWDNSWGERWGSDPYAYSVTGAAGGGVTALQIADPVSSGVTPFYYFTLPHGDGLNPNYVKARTNGWSMETQAQYVSSTGGANQGLSVFFDNREYLVLMDRDGAGNLRGSIQTSPTTYASYVLAPPATANDYHHYELRYDPATQLVSFLFEGSVKHTWLGIGGNHENRFAFGSIIPSTGGITNFRETNTYILAPPPTPTQQGDFNGDGLVNLGDYSMWRDSLGSTTLLAADANGNGRVDSLDYAVWKSNFGQRLAGGVSAVTGVSIPEPTALLLALLAAGGLLAHKKGPDCNKCSPAL